uniref:Uncharacterized protein n=1 Tax=Anopheles merus TaxID=30066 RepID=A0A182VKS9_ANOME
MTFEGALYHSPSESSEKKSSNTSSSPVYAFLRRLWRLVVLGLLVVVVVPLDAMHRLQTMRVVRPSYGLTPERWLPVDDLCCAHQRRDQLPQIVPNAAELMLNVVKQGRESDQTDTTRLFTKLHHWRQRKRLALLNHRKEC